MRLPAKDLSVNKVFVPASGFWPALAARKSQNPRIAKNTYENRTGTQSRYVSFNAGPDRWGFAALRLEFTKFFPAKLRTSPKSKLRKSRDLHGQRHRHKEALRSIVFALGAFEISVLSGGPSHSVAPSG
jgi:hypothetical protein